MRARLTTLAVTLALILGACSNQSTGQYADDVAAITTTMRRESVKALPDPSQPTREAVEGVTAARQRAVEALSDIAPPTELQLEHSAFVFALSELVSGSNALLADTTGLDPEDFAAALSAATDLVQAAALVGTTCRSVAERVTQMGINTDLHC